LKQCCVATQQRPFTPSPDLPGKGEATMRIVEMFASTVIAVGSLALVAGVLSL
jgi:hypothetical protein